jgi:hypothetical protein
MTTQLFKFYPIQKFMESVQEEHQQSILAPSVLFHNKDIQQLHHSQKSLELYLCNQQKEGFISPIYQSSQMGRIIHGIE